MIAPTPAGREPVSNPEQFTPDPADVELVDLIEHAWRTAPCPKCGRVKACRCLLGDEELRKYRARAVLDALAAAGRLFPPDTDTHAEYAVRLTWDDGDVAYHESERWLAADRAAYHATRRAEGPWRIVSAEVVQRTVITSVGPWRPVPSAGDTP